MHDHYIHTGTHPCFENLMDSRVNCHECFLESSSHSWITLQAPHNCLHKLLYITAAQVQCGEEHVQRIPALSLSYLRGVVEEQPLQGTKVLWGWAASFFVLPHTGLEGLVAAIFLIQPFTIGWLNTLPWPSSTINHREKCINEGSLLPIASLYTTMEKLHQIRTWICIISLNLELGGVHTTPKMTAMATVCSRFAVHTSRFVMSQSP